MKWTVVEQNTLRFGDVDKVQRKREKSVLYDVVSCAGICICMVEKGTVEHIPTQIIGI